MRAITRLEPIHHQILNIGLEQAIQVLKPGAIAVADQHGLIWRHPDTEHRVGLALQNSLSIYVSPSSNPAAGVLLRTGQRDLSEADLWDLDRIAAHIAWVADLALRAEPKGGSIDNHNQSIANAVAAVCAMHPEAHRMTNVHLTAKSHERAWSLCAMSNVEIADLSPDLLKWAKTETLETECFNDYYGEDHMLTVPVWHAYPSGMDENRIRAAINIVPERLRDSVVAVRRR